VGEIYGTGRPLIKGARRKEKHTIDGVFNGPIDEQSGFQ
jgi:hypothetical protein